MLMHARKSTRMMMAVVMVVASNTEADQSGPDGGLAQACARFLVGWPAAME